MDSPNGLEFFVEITNTVSAKIERYKKLGT